MRPDRGTDPRDTPFVLGTRKIVTLVDGRELCITGRAFSRDWQLTDQAGRVVLGADAQGSSFSFHPDAFVVRSDEESLNLVQIVGIVELNRLIVKAGRNSAAAAVGGAGGASS